MAYKASSFGEIVEEVRRQKTNREKIEVLEKYKEDGSFKTFLKLVYGDRDQFEFDLPKKLEYQKSRSPLGLGRNTIRSEMSRMRLFNKSYELDKNRKRDLFLQILEGLDDVEADILAHAATKKRIKGLGRKLVISAFGESVLDL